MFVQIFSPGQTWSHLINTHISAVKWVIEGFDDFELVEHLAYYHNAGPHSRNTGSKRSQPWEWECKHPQYQEERIHQGNLFREITAVQFSSWCPWSPEFYIWIEKNSYFWQWSLPQIYWKSITLWQVQFFEKKWNKIKLKNSPLLIIKKGIINVHLKICIKIYSGPTSNILSRSNTCTDPTLLSQYGFWYVLLTVLFQFERALW